MDTKIIEVAKKKLIESAKKKYGEIEPCGDNPFREDGGVLYFWFNSPDESTRLIHTHLIQEKIN